MPGRKSSLSQREDDPTKINRSRDQRRIVIQCGSLLMVSDPLHPYISSILAYLFRKTNPQLTFFIEILSGHRSLLCVLATSAETQLMSEKKHVG